MLQVVGGLFRLPDPEACDSQLVMEGIDTLFSSQYVSQHSFDHVLSVMERSGLGGAQCLLHQGEVLTIQNSREVLDVVLSFLKVICLESRQGHAVMRKGLIRNRDFGVMGMGVIPSDHQTLYVRDQRIEVCWRQYLLIEDRHDADRRSDLSPNLEFVVA